MEIQLLIVIILLGLGILGLTVGVANDAVNFMNSAIGSKAASRRAIVTIAAIGILVGVTFSSGMMEVARKGIFLPQYFTLWELLIIFMAAMLQNILLLDIYNTFGLPTSTTVSIVFGLFGGAFAISTLKVIAEGEQFATVFTYINTGNVFTIITGIFMSIVAAFIVGSFVQYITRLIFTFDFKKRFRRYGAIWGGIALTAITYFILIKGAKGASFLTEEFIASIQNNTSFVVLISFAFWTILLQLIMWFTKINILKIIVLVGTFSLAMAFAANDLVNFIGAPIAALQAYNLTTGINDPLNTTMESMSGKIPANTWFLLISGAIMVLTLYLSKKTRTVTKTELSLSKQDEGAERFESYALSRLLVRMVISFIDYFKKIVPESVSKKISKRFDASFFQPEKAQDGEKPSFDLIRASVNLMVAATLISFATSLKLPLSTTYITFIVAMSTALPDRAWGRESAVYRVSGVLTVVGGWFFTAFIGMLVAMLIATIIFYGGIYAILALLLLTGFIIIRSSKVHKERDEIQKKEEAETRVQLNTPREALDYVFNSVGDYFSSIDAALSLSYKGLCKQNLKQLKKARKQAKKIQKSTNVLVSDVLKVLRFASEEELEQGHIFATPLGALHEMSDRLRSITNENYDYFDNNHHPFTEDQINELKEYNKAFSDLFCRTGKSIRTKFEQPNDITKDDDFKVTHQFFIDVLKKNNKNQIKRIQKSQSNKRRSILYLNLLDDTRALADNSRLISDSCEEFYQMLKKSQRQ